MRAGLSYLYSQKELGRGRVVGLVVALGIGLALSCSAWASEPGGPDDNRAYLTANGLLNRGLYELAAPEYERFLDEHPDHADVPSATYGLGVCLFRLARYEEALKHFDRVIEQEDFAFAAEALLLHGHCRLALGDFAGAASSFEALAEQYPEHASADDGVALRAEALYRAGSFKQCRHVSDQLIERYAQSDLRERTELFGGMAALALGDLDDASTRFETMLERFPDGEHAAQAALLLARADHRGGHAERAIRTYRNVLQRGVETYLPEAMLGLAQLLGQAGQTGDSADLLDAMLDRFGDSELIAAAQLQRGRLAFDDGDYAQAREFFEPVKDASDASLRDDASYWLAKCDLRDGDNRQAADALSEAIRHYPESELLDEMIYDRAIALTRAGVDDAAVIGLAAFRSQYPDHELAADALYTQASIEHGRDAYDQSLELCDAFLHQHADHTLTEAAMFLAAENEFLSQRFEQSEGRYRALLERFSAGEYAERARYRLGMSLANQDRFEESEPYLRTVSAKGDTPEMFRAALLAIGDGHFQAGQWDRAEEFLSDYLGFGLEMPGADDALLKRGLARQRQSQYEGAIDDFDRLLREFDESPHRLQAIFERGQAMVELERWDDADESFRVALDLDSESRFAPYAMNHLGAIAQRRGEFREAADWFGRASAAGGDDIEVSAQYERGRALLAERDYLDAAGVLAGVVEQHPDHALAPAAQAYRSIALSRADHLEEALTEIDRLGDMDVAALEQPLRHSVNYELAWCLLELGRDEEASRAYGALLGKPIAHDLRAYALVDLAGIEMRSEHHDEAVPLLEEALGIIESGSASITPELTERAVYRLGACRLRQEQFDAVVVLLDDFSEQFPDSAVLSSASLMCGEALLKTGNHSRAAEHLERVVAGSSSDESYAPALLRLGEASATLQRWDRSGEAFGEYLDRYPDSDLWFQARFGVGCASENAGNCSGATESYQEVVDRHDGPTAARAQFQIGECLFASRQYEDAVRELLKVDILYAYPQWSAAALFEAGRCFEAIGQLTDARKQFDEVIERFGDSQWAASARERLEAVERAGTIPGR